MKTDSPKRKPIRIAVLCLIVAAALVLALLCGGFLRGSGSAVTPPLPLRPAEESFGTTPATVKNVVAALSTNPAELVRSHLTGGIGVRLRPDASTGRIVIDGLLADSPADKAGLHSGDAIAAVNGQSMAGLKLADVIEAIRGFAAGSVTVTVQRGQTNLSFAIHRNSMNSLLQRTNSTN